MDVYCRDFLAFEETLKNLRRLDDNIVHALNTTIPTPSFAVKGADPTAQCKQLYDQLVDSHQNREATIKKCILQVSEQVQHLRKLRDEDDSNFEVQKDLRKEQNKLRMMQTELNIEEVIKDRSIKTFYERCRPFYRPDQLL